MRRALPAALASMALILGSGSPGRAGNLLTNPEFDDGTPLPWANSDSDATLIWGNADHGACGGVSGAALASIQAVTADAARNFFVCISPVVPNVTYSIGGWLMFPTPQVATGEVDIRALWTTESGCGGTGISSQNSSKLLSDTKGTWNRIAMNATAPATAAALSLRVRPKKVEAGSTLTLLFDGMFVTEDSGFLFGDGFEVGSTCRWSSTVSEI